MHKPRRSHPLSFKIFCVLAALAAFMLLGEIYKISWAVLRMGDVPQGYALEVKDADLTVVEFLDYTCIYCREVHPTILEAVRRDGRVRYVPRPIAFTQDASAALMLAYNAGAQGKFMQGHEYLMQNDQKIDAGYLEAFVTKLGLAQEKFIDQAPAIKKQEKENMLLYRRLGGPGTPFFMIGRKIAYMPRNAMPSVEDFLRLFDEARRAG